MNHSISDKSPTIEAVQKHFEAWRSNRIHKREPIPKDLWQAATGLCREHTISRVSQQLRLSYSDLRKRIPEGHRSPVQFMEIDLDPPSGGWQIDCSRTDGSYLRMTGNGQPPAIENVLKSFLS